MGGKARIFAWLGKNQLLRLNQEKLPESIEIMINFAYLCSNYPSSPTINRKTILFSPEEL